MVSLSPSLGGMSLFVHSADVLVCRDDGCQFLESDQEFAADFVRAMLSVHSRLDGGQPLTLIDKVLDN